MSKSTGVLLSVAEIIAHNPKLTLVVLGFSAMLMGWAFGEALIIVLGLHILIFGIVSEESPGEPARSPVH